LKSEHLKRRLRNLQKSNQRKPGIKILFSSKADLDKTNKALEEFCRAGEIPVGKDRIIILVYGGYASGFGGMQFYCYSTPNESPSSFLKSAFPFSTAYESIVWVKDLEGNTLWQNRDFNEDGSLKQKIK
jgi:hypothetical protein